jgi:hypothetical protein
MARQSCLSWRHCSRGIAERISQHQCRRYPSRSRLPQSCHCSCSELGERLVGEPPHWEDRVDFVVSQCGEPVNQIERGGNAFKLTFREPVRNDVNTFEGGDA